MCSLAPLCEVAKRRQVPPERSIRHAVLDLGCLRPARHLNALHEWLIPRTRSYAKTDVHQIASVDSSETRKPHWANHWGLHSTSYQTKAFTLLVATPIRPRREFSKIRSYQYAAPSTDCTASGVSSGRGLLHALLKYGTMSGSCSQRRPIIPNNSWVTPPKWMPIHP